jgi:hypothetical protein
MPVTVPVELIVAIVVSLLLQTPPDVLLESVMVEPAHTELRPPITPGNGLTVIVLDLKHPVGSV